MADRNISRHFRRCVQRGQALAEFLVTLVALVPLFFIIPMIGNYLDLRSSVVQAGRYAVWERTIWLGDSNTAAKAKSDGDIQNEIRERFFGAVDTPLRYDDKASRSKLRAQNNLVWSDHTGQKIMLEPYQGGASASLNHARDQLPTTSAVSMIGSAASVISLGQSGFDLNKNGMYQAKVQITIRPPPQLVVNLKGDSTSLLALPAGQNIIFGGGGGTTFGTGALLADAWSAKRPGSSSSDPGSVHKQVAGLVPSAMMPYQASLDALAIRPAGSISRAGVVGTDFPQFDAGKILVEVLPGDRF
jgi:hypothetical protein